jgi:hypothetical protein
MQFTEFYKIAILLPQLAWAAMTVSIGAFPVIHGPVRYSERYRVMANTDGAETGPLGGEMGVAAFITAHAVNVPLTAYPSARCDHLLHRLHT